MRSARQRSKAELVLRRDFFDDPGGYAAYAELMLRVFDHPAEPLEAGAPGEPTWRPFAFFDGANRCVASVEAAILALILDGAEADLTAIRLAAVSEDWRGLGLFRDLMTRALAWCEAEIGGPTLLYTEDHALYERFGFRPLAQHAFFGQAPEPIPARLARAVGRQDVNDPALVRRLLATRTPVSNRCAIVRADSLFIDNMGADDLVLAHSDDLDVLVAYEVEEETIVVVDVVAAVIPSMAQILGVLPVRRAQMASLFPPDRLAWYGAPQPDETGLMIRGAVPPAMRHPFMLPPTTEF